MPTSPTGTRSGCSTGTSSGASPNSLSAELRYILVDRYVALAPGRSARAVRHVTAAWTDRAGTMPATLVLEAMAQTAGMLSAATSRWREKMVLAKIDEAHFPGAARAGDRIDLAAEMLDAREGTYRLRATASVGGRVIGEATILLRGLGLDSPEGRAFDTEAYRAARAENLRALGVTDLVEAPA